MTTKEAAAELGELISELQTLCSETVKSMCRAETLAMLRDMQRQADQMRVAIESMQRAYVVLTPLAREIELTEAAMQAKTARQA